MKTGPKWHRTEGEQPCCRRKRTPVALVTWVSGKALGGIQWLLVPASAGGAGGERKAGKSREVTRPVLSSLTSAHTSPGPKRSQESLWGMGSLVSTPWSVFLLLQILIICAIVWFLSLHNTAHMASIFKTPKDANGFKSNDWGRVQILRFFISRSHRSRKGQQERVLERAGMFQNDKCCNLGAHVLLTVYFHAQTKLAILPAFL